MPTLSTIVMLILAPVLGIPRTALATDPVHCTTREDRQFKRLITECTDGSRAISRYDAQFQRWRTDIVRAPKGDKPPYGWPIPGKGSR